MKNLCNIFRILLIILGVLLVIYKIKYKEATSIFYAYLSLCFLFLSYESYEKNNIKNLKLYIFCGVINAFLFIIFLV